LRSKGAVVQLPDPPRQQFRLSAQRPPEEAQRFKVYAYDQSPEVQQHMEQQERRMR